MWRCPRYGRASADFTGPVQPTAGLLGATRWAVVDSGVVAKGRRFSDDDILEAIRAAAPPAGAAVDDAGLCGRPDAVIGRGRRWPRRPVASGARRSWWRGRPARRTRLIAADTTTFGSMATLQHLRSRPAGSLSTGSP
jgi:hypothetical protein